MNLLINLAYKSFRNVVSETFIMTKACQIKPIMPEPPERY